MIREAISSLRDTVDEVIGVFSPETVKNRVLKRFQGELLKREYEAASRGRRTQNWRAQRKHPSVEANVNSTIEERVRDLVRNDGYAKRGLEVLTVFTVGTGLQASVRDKSGKKNDEMTMAFNKWAKSLDCDVRRNNNFFGLQTLCMSETITAGEVLVLKQNNPVPPGLGKVPLQLLVMESSYLDSKMDDGVSLLSGIQFQGQTPKSYFIKNVQSPGAKVDQNSKAVPASEVIHLFKEERPGMVRGVSWFAPIVTPLRDLDEYRDAELMRRKVAACFAAFVTNSLTDLTEEAKETFSKMEPGAVEFLGPGQDVKFSAPPPTSEYAPYTQTELQKIAAGMGITYEHLSQNLRDVNFSSARVGQIPFQKFIKKWQTQLVVPKLLDQVFEWFKEAAVPSLGSAWADATVEWSLPRVEMLDELKETDAVVAKIRSGLTSQSEAIRTLGGDPERVLKEIDTDNQTLDSYKIILDTDPRKTTKAGIIQSSYESGGQTIDE